MASSALYYLDDLSVGQRFASKGSVTVTEERIKSFAAEFDPQPFHLDHEAAKASLFGGLAASGWHTAAVTMKLVTDGGMPIAGGNIGASGELAWPRPTRPGDVLRVEAEVLEITPSRSKPDRGMVTMRIETKNQKDELVQSFTVKMPVPRRAAP
ncbi:MAG: MaoC family dehydratase [Ferrovibrio sp.]